MAYSACDSVDTPSVDFFRISLDRIIVHEESEQTHDGSSWLVWKINDAYMAGRPPGMWSLYPGHF